jgi:hypothetical protein
MTPRPGGRDPKPQTLALVFLVPIGILVAASILGCGAMAYALQFVRIGSP